jgi:DNA polymerase III alpha subunit
MATFRHVGTVHHYQSLLIEGMAARGYPRDFAERCFEQIKGFGEYGFPESHAQAFAWLAYVSSWLKCHYPAVFACALLNSQPMGFYAPAQLVRDAREHGVMEDRGYRQAMRLGGMGNNRPVRVAGIVLVRQRPGTASGVIFATIEDETGIVNVIIWPKTFERFRRIVLGAKLLGVDGRLQREGRVIHVIADRLTDLSADLSTLTEGGPPVPPPLARADEARRPGRDPDYRSRDFH